MNKERGKQCQNLGIAPTAVVHKQQEKRERQSTVMYKRTKLIEPSSDRRRENYLNQLISMVVQLQEYHPN